MWCPMVMENGNMIIPLIQTFEFILKFGGTISSYGSKGNML
jgi:hypothetical protein